jgi:glutaminase
MIEKNEQVSNLQKILDDIIENNRFLTSKGQVAEYIPALAEVCPDKLGIALYSVEHGLITAGDAGHEFSIQSISKLFSLTIAMQIAPDSLWERVGREPSGQAFNSMIQLESEQGIPRNPFINAGAILICDILRSRLSNPHAFLLKLLKELSGNENIISDERIASSEYWHSARNTAMAYLMKSFGNFSNEVNRVLKTYFYNCAIKMNCADLAIACSFLANKGKCPLTGKTIVSPQQAKQLNGLMTTSGLYQGVGSFAYRVGLPGKSGVGGGIVAVMPNKMTACVYSPGLDLSGNSLAGIAALEQLTTTLNQSVF